MKTVQMEEVIIAKTINRLLTTLNLDAKFAEVNQQLGFIHRSVEP